MHFEFLKINLIIIKNKNIFSNNLLKKQYVEISQGMDKLGKKPKMLFWSIYLNYKKIIKAQSKCCKKLI